MSILGYDKDMSILVIRIHFRLGGFSCCRILSGSCVIFSFLLVSNTDWTILLATATSSQANLSAILINKDISGRILE